MALKVYVISHAATGAVLTAFTARDGADTTQLLADTVGSGIPVRIMAADIAAPMNPFVVDASVLRLDPTSEDPVSNDPGSVLFAPWQHVVKIDPTTNKLQNLLPAKPPTVTADLTTLEITVQLPSPVTLVAPAATLAGWLQLYASTSHVLGTPQVLSFAPTTSGTTSTVQATFTPLAQVDTALLFVEGCGVYAGTFP